MAEDVTGEVTELLQVLIRNQCVNDGNVESGQEIRSADVLTQVLEWPGIDVQRYEPEPGRTSVVARIEGTNPDAPSLLLMGHTDVVPVSPERWKHDPFGGEVIDGEVWGRGAGAAADAGRRVSLLWRTAGSQRRYQTRVRPRIERRRLR